MISGCTLSQSTRTATRASSLLLPTGILRQGTSAHHTWDACPDPHPDRRTAYCAVHPPSIGSETPVMVAAASEHRNTASAPMPAGVVNSVIGCFSDSSCCLA